MSSAELKLQVEEAISSLKSLDRCQGKAAIDFGRGIHRSQQSKLMTVILTGEPYSSSFDKPPQTCHDDACVIVEDYHPIELTFCELLKPKPDKPREFIHCNHACDLQFDYLPPLNAPCRRANSIFESGLPSGAVVGTVAAGCEAAGGVAGDAGGPSAGAEAAGGAGAAG